MGRCNSNPCAAWTFAAERVGLGIGYPVAGVYDLGMPTRDGNADPGENSIARLLMMGSAAIHVSGNTWNPNQQDADGQGRYPEGLVLTVESGQTVDGPNFFVAALEPGAAQLAF